MFTMGGKPWVKVWDQWKPHVSNVHSAVRSLQLHHLDPEHKGTYTCEVSTPEETYITWTEVTVAEGTDVTQEGENKMKIVLSNI